MTPKMTVNIYHDTNDQRIIDYIKKNLETDALVKEVPAAMPKTDQVWNMCAFVVVIAAILATLWRMG